MLFFVFTALFAGVRPGGHRRRHDEHRDAVRVHPRLRRRVDHARAEPGRSARVPRARRCRSSRCSASLVCGAMIYGLGWTNWLRLGVWLVDRPRRSTSRTASSTASCARSSLDEVRRGPGRGPGRDRVPDRGHLGHAGTDSDSASDSTSDAEWESDTDSERVGVRGPAVAEDLKGEWRTCSTAADCLVVEGPCCMAWPANAAGKGKVGAALKAFAKTRTDCLATCPAVVRKPFCEHGLCVVWQ